MQRFVQAVCLFGACTLSALAHADRVVLVGGTVLEGRTATKNGKVVVQTEAGEVAVPADSVARVEKSEAAANKFDARYAALAPGDVQGRLELAEWCRNRDMRARERKLLLEVIELDRDNERARARLGHVKTDTGWVTESDAMHAKGYVRDAGRWVNRTDYVELERLRLQREAQAQAAEAAEAERHAKNLELSMRQTELEQQRSHLPTPVYPTYFTPFYRPFAPGVVVPFRPPLIRSVPPPSPAPAMMPPAFDTTTLSVVKVAYRRH